MTSVKPRAFDHLVLAVADLDAAARRFSALGFTVGSRNRHPWGTQNHIVLFDGFFIEIIGLGPDFAKLEHQPLGRNQLSDKIIRKNNGLEHFLGSLNPDDTLELQASVAPFTGAILDRLAQGEGACLLAMRSDDADADAQALAQKQFLRGSPFAFSRLAKTADGQTAEVGFRIVFTQMSQAQPQGLLFLCEHLSAKHFWSAQMQSHDNGARTVKRLTMLAENPADYADYLSSVVSQPEFRATSMGLEIDVENGILQVLSPPAFQFRFTVPAPVYAQPFFAAIEFSGLLPQTLAERARQAGIEPRMIEHRCLIAPEDLFGLALLAA